MTTAAGPVCILPVSWAARADDLLAIRNAVFVEEQGVPREMEVDALDPLARHFLALTATQPVGTARLALSGQIGRMAVLPAFRGRGIGHQLLSTVLAVAKQAHMDHLFLHAQLSAVGFYALHGFIPTGSTFVEAGIVHQQMERPVHAGDSSYDPTRSDH